MIKMNTLKNDNHSKVKQIFKKTMKKVVVHCWIRTHEKIFSKLRSHQLNVTVICSPPR